MYYCVLSHAPKPYSKYESPYITPQLKPYNSSVDLGNLTLNRTGPVSPKCKPQKPQPKGLGFRAKIQAGPSLRTAGGSQSPALALRRELAKCHPGWSSCFSFDCCIRISQVIEWSVMLVFSFTFGFFSGIWGRLLRGTHYLAIVVRPVWDLWLSRVRGFFVCFAVLGLRRGFWFRHLEVVIKWDKSKFVLFVKIYKLTNKC